VIWYKGIRTTAGATVHVVDSGRRSLLPPCNNIRNHSPTGFEWGYGGSGPAQLALALCVHALDGDARRAQSIYQDLKFRIVGRLESDRWALSKETIVQTIHDLEAENRSNHQGVSMTATTAAAPACPRCRDRSGHQVYVVHGELGRYVFDQRKARAMIQANPREAYPIPPEVVEKFLEVNNEWHEEHVDHVDSSDPGIIGQRFGGMALFDGTHRARRSLRDHTQFMAYFLTLEESNACLIDKEVAEMSVEIIAREIKGVLRNNQNAELLEVEIGADDYEQAGASEEAIRQHLTPEENGRVCILVIDNSQEAEHGEAEA